MDFIADFKDVQFAILVHFFATCNFWGGYVTGLVYDPPLPVNLEELRQRISTALQTVIQDMLQRVWEELEYQIFEIGYEIHISLNFSIKFGAIIFSLFTITTV